MRLPAVCCVAVLGAALLLAGCSGGGKPPLRPMGAADNGFDSRPRDPRFHNEQQPDVALRNDACALLDARPHWREALAQTRSEWQIHTWYVLAFMHQESSFNPKALSTSDAYGYAQVKAPTWDWYMLKRGRRNVSRERFDDAVDFIGWYAHQNVARNGVALNDVRNQYLAYHEGLGGYESGSFMAKPWLLTISDKVADRAMFYQGQLLECPF